ncbi:MAG: hypothetical protein K2V38_01430 [Gemmataceae bacterium]|nr:hypothetical protein [Gemmataceae bacterium]
MLESEHDTIPPDDREYGWLTLTRATRQFAHHLGVIPLDRLLAPLPATRSDARREIEPLLDGLLFARRGSGGPPVHGGMLDRTETASGASDLAVEAGRLLVEAQRGFARSSSEFMIVALPPRSEGEGARMQRCDENAPEMGEIRDGVFYWPFKSLRSLGFARFGGNEGLAFVALDGDGSESKAFVEFCGRAAALLLAAAPPWSVINRPGPPMTVWPATIMFVAPSARTQTTERPTGAFILNNPWAASIAALRDILNPPPPAVPPDPPPREVPQWDATARRLSFRGRECKRFAKPAQNQELVLAAFQEEGWPEAIDDPLPGGKLGRTVESLNDRLEHIRFRLNGAGTGVIWQPV